MLEEARELLILGILRRAPMSPYALNRTVRAHTPLYRTLKQGNVYHLVAKLGRRGLLLSKTSQSERGPKPFKSVFRLSAAGERRFHELLDRIVTDVQSPDPAVESALVLLAQLPREQARRMIGERLQAVRDQEKRLSRLFGSDSGRSGGGHLALAHTAARLRGEQQFLRESLALFDNRRWHPDWPQ